MEVHLRDIANIQHHNIGMPHIQNNGIIKKKVIKKYLSFFINDIETKQLNFL